VSEDKEPQRKKVVAGPAQLRWLDAEHLGMFRPVYLKNEDGTEGEHLRDVGPLVVLREARPDEEQAVAMITFDPVSKRPIKLVEVENLMSRDGTPMTELFRQMKEKREAKP
jgi:hypothetical protein